jgi:hypothetical protein
VVEDKGRNLERIEEQEEWHGDAKEEGDGADPDNAIETADDGNSAGGDEELTDFKNALSISPPLPASEDLLSVFPLVYQDSVTFDFSAFKRETEQESRMMSVKAALRIPDPQETAILASPFPLHVPGTFNSVSSTPSSPEFQRASASSSSSSSAPTSPTRPLIPLLLAQTNQQGCEVTLAAAKIQQEVVEQGGEGQIHGEQEENGKKKRPALSEKKGSWVSGMVAIYEKMKM